MDKTGKITIDGISVIRNDGTEDTIHIPYNPHNILITEKDVMELLNRYGIHIDKVNHLKYFQQAMTHKSYIQKSIFTEDILKKAKSEINEKVLELCQESYERLEYLGDRVIKLVLAFYLFNRYPEQDEGFMTKLQIAIEQKSQLAKMGLDMGLGKFFIISKQIEQMGARESERFNEDVFEAFMGALFLSNGFKPCALLLINMFETQIDYTEKLYRNKNYKDSLMQYYHSQQWEFPEYFTIASYGPVNKRTFICGVKKYQYNKKNIEDMNPLDVGIGFGYGNRKKDAEQMASKMALIKLEQLNEDQYVEDDIFYPDMNDISQKVFQSQEDKQAKIEEKEKERERVKKMLENTDQINSILGGLMSDDNQLV